VESIVNLLKQFDRNGNSITIAPALSMANSQFGTENFASLKTDVLYNGPAGKALGKP